MINTLDINIIYDQIEKYKESFFIRFEQSKTHYLLFLENERKYIILVLDNFIKNQGKIVEEDLLYEGRSMLFYEICGSKSIRILQDFKDEIFKLKNVDESSCLEVAEEILEKNNLGAFMAMSEDNLIENENFIFLIDYLSDFLHSFYMPEQMPDNNSILKFVNIEMDKARANILNKVEVKDAEPEPLTTKQLQKIGLLIRSGIINYLKEKNPKITPNQIAGFIALLSKEPLKQTSINPNLNKENKNYPIKNQQDKNDLDFILRKYGISPQSE